MPELKEIYLDVFQPGWTEYLKREGYTVRVTEKPYGAPGSIFMAKNRKTKRGISIECGYYRWASWYSVECIWPGSRYHMRYTQSPHECSLWIESFVYYDSIWDKVTQELDIPLKEVMLSAPIRRHDHVLTWCKTGMEVVGIEGPDARYQILYGSYQKRPWALTIFRHGTGTYRCSTAVGLCKRLLRTTED